MALRLEVASNRNVFEDRIFYVLVGLMGVVHVGSYEPALPVQGA